MTMMMDNLNGNGPLQPSHSMALCFSSDRLSLHGLEASTSNAVNITELDVFTPGYNQQFVTPSSSASSSYSHCIHSSSDDAFRFKVPHVASLSHSAPPGPTSCVFLQKALKRLYAKEDFEVLESLGEGFFGDVYKVRHRVTGEVMVLKVGKEREKESRPRAKASVLKEVAVLNELTSHSNLLAFRGVCVEVDPSEGLWNLHILVDYCDGGSLNRLICDRQRTFPWRLRCNLAKDISCAMSYVHSKNIMHRDLTSMNVLLQSVACDGLKAVVADFGLSCPIPARGERLIQVGTPYWMAPECLKEEFYDEKADVFSFGIIMCQMIARIDADPEAGLFRTNNFGLDYIRFPAHCQLDTPLELLKLAFQCCLMDPSARPPFSSIHARLRDFVRSRWTDGLTRVRMEAAVSDSKLERSLSDAALKSASHCKHTSSTYFSPPSDGSTCDRAGSVLYWDAKRSALRCGLFSLDGDGDVYEEEDRKKCRMEELARSVAVEEEPLDLETTEGGNPFMSHQVYSTTRKLALPDMVSVRRRRSTASEQTTASQSPHSSNEHPPSTVSTQGNGDVVDWTFVSGEERSYKCNKSPQIIRQQRDVRVRRSFSLPTCSVSPRNMMFVDEDVVDPSVSSTPSCAASPLRTRVLMCDAAGQRILQGRMTMNFKHEDQKFTLRRYPGRRHTLMNGSLMGGGEAMIKSCHVGYSKSVDEVAPLSSSSPLIAHSPLSDMRTPTDSQIYSSSSISPVVVLQPLSVRHSPGSTSVSQQSGKESYSGSVCSSISPLSKEEEDESGNDYEWNASNASKHRVESPQHRKMDTVVCSSLDAVQSRDRQLGAASLMCAVGRQVGCHADSCATLLTNTFADERRQPSAAANGVDSCILL